MPPTEPRRFWFACWMDGEPVRTVSVGSEGLAVEAWRSGAWVPIDEPRLDLLVQAPPLLPEFCARVGLPAEAIFEV